MSSIGDSSYQLPAQMDELKRIIGTRHIDVLTVSVGGNDVNFRTLVDDLIENTYSGSPSLPSILAEFRSSLIALPQHYAELAQAIQSVNPGQVLITPYPDLARNQKGNVATILSPLDIPLISKRDARFATTKLLPQLNAAVAAAAQTYHWSIVQGITADFRTHGYPSTTSWIRTLGESLEMQGDEDGTFHPNAAGHLDIARRLLATYLGTTSTAGKISGRVRRIAPVRRAVEAAEANPWRRAPSHLKTNSVTQAFPR
jgi:lysophospholipase L1-like esterase